MKILFFSRDYTPHDHRFLNSLAKTEHQVYYLRLEKGRYSFEERPLPPEVTVVEWGGGKRPVSWLDGPRLVIDLKNLVRKLKPDLVQAGPLQRSALLTALAGIRPLISMSWGYDLLQDAGRNMLWRQATRYVLAHSDLMIGDCATIRRLAVDYGMPDQHIITFPWGIDLAHFSPKDNLHSNNQQDRLSSGTSFTVLSTRSWESIYGVETIAQSFIKVAKELHDLRLVMLGNGSLATALQQNFREAGLIPDKEGSPADISPRVSFPGQVGFEDLPAFYRNSDLYISASHSDGTSISLLEAMACGLPVVVSDIPGNREWVVPEENGWLFRDGSSDDLAMVIRKAYENRERLPEMGKKARRTVEGRADWNQNFSKMLESYKSVIAQYNYA